MYHRVKPHRLYCCTVLHIEWVSDTDNRCAVEASLWPQGGQRVISAVQTVNHSHSRLNIVQRYRPCNRWSIEGRKDHTEHSSNGFGCPILRRFFDTTLSTSCAYVALLSTLLTVREVGCICFNSP